MHIFNAGRGDFCIIEEKATDGTVVTTMVDSGPIQNDKIGGNQINALLDAELRKMGVLAQAEGKFTLKLTNLVFSHQDVDHIQYFFNWLAGKKMKYNFDIGRIVGRESVWSHRCAYKKPFTRKLDDNYDAEELLGIDEIKSIGLIQNYVAKDDGDLAFAWKKKQAAAARMLFSLDNSATGSKTTNPLKDTNDKNTNSIVTVYTPPGGQKKHRCILGGDGTGQLILEACAMMGSDDNEVIECQFFKALHHGSRKNNYVYSFKTSDFDGLSADEANQKTQCILKGIALCILILYWKYKYSLFEDGEEWQKNWYQRLRFFTYQEIKEVDINFWLNNDETNFSEWFKNGSLAEEGNVFLSTFLKLLSKLEKVVTFGGADAQKELFNDYKVQASEIIESFNTLVNKYDNDVFPEPDDKQKYFLSNFFIANLLYRNVCTKFYAKISADVICVSCNHMHGMPSMQVIFAIIFANTVLRKDKDVVIYCTNTSTAMLNTWVDLKRELDAVRPANWGTRVKIIQSEDSNMRVVYNINSLTMKADNVNIFEYFSHPPDDQMEVEKAVSTKINTEPKLQYKIAFFFEGKACVVEVENTSLVIKEKIIMGEFEEKSLFKKKPKMEPIFYDVHIKNFEDSPLLIVEFSDFKGLSMELTAIFSTDSLFRVSIDKKVVKREISPDLLYGGYFTWAKLFDVTIETSMESRMLFSMPKVKISNVSVADDTAITVGGETHSNQNVEVPLVQGLSGRLPSSTARVVDVVCIMVGNCRGQLAINGWPSFLLKHEFHLWNVATAQSVVIFPPDSKSDFALGQFGVIALGTRCALIFPSSLSLNAFVEEVFYSVPAMRPFCSRFSSIDGNLYTFRSKYDSANIWLCLNGNWSETSFQVWIPCNKFDDLCLSFSDISNTTKLLSILSSIGSATYPENWLNNFNLPIFGLSLSLFLSRVSITFVRVTRGIDRVRVGSLYFNISPKDNTWTGISVLSSILLSSLSCDVSKPAFSVRVSNPFNDPAFGGAKLSLDVDFTLNVEIAGSGTVCNVPVRFSKHLLDSDTDEDNVVEYSLYVGGDRGMLPLPLADSVRPDVAYGNDYRRSFLLSGPRPSIRDLLKVFKITCENVLPRLNDTLDSIDLIQLEVQCKKLNEDVEISYMSFAVGVSSFQFTGVPFVRNFSFINSEFRFVYSLDFWSVELSTIAIFTCVDATKHQCKIELTYTQYEDCKSFMITLDNDDKDFTLGSVLNSVINDFGLSHIDIPCFSPLLNATAIMNLKCEITDSETGVQLENFAITVSYRNELDLGVLKFTDILLTVDLKRNRGAMLDKKFSFTGTLNGKCGVEIAFSSIGENTYKLAGNLLATNDVNSVASCMSILNSEASIPSLYESQSLRLILATFDLSVKNDGADYNCTCNYAELRLSGFVPLLANSQLGLSSIVLSFNRNSGFSLQGKLSAANASMIVTLRGSGNKLTGAIKQGDKAITIGEFAKAIGGSADFLGLVPALSNIYLKTADWTVECIDSLWTVTGVKCIVGFGTYQVSENPLLIINGAHFGISYTKGAATEFLYFIRGTITLCSVHVDALYKVMKDKIVAVRLSPATASPSSGSLKLGGLVNQLQNYETELTKVTTVALTEAPTGLIIDVSPSFAVLANLNLSKKKYFLYGCFADFGSGIFYMDRDLNTTQESVEAVESQSTIPQGYVCVVQTAPEFQFTKLFPSGVFNPIAVAIDEILTIESATLCISSFETRPWSSIVSNISDVMNPKSTDSGSFVSDSQLWLSADSTSSSTVLTSFELPDSVNSGKFCYIQAKIRMDQNSTGFLKNIFSIQASNNANGIELLAFFPVGSKSATDRNESLIIFTGKNIDITLLGSLHLRNGTIEYVAGKVKEDANDRPVDREIFTITCHLSLSWNMSGSQPYEQHIAQTKVLMGHNRTTLTISLADGVIDWFGWNFFAISQSEFNGEFAYENGVCTPHHKMKMIVNILDVSFDLVMLFKDYEPAAFVVDLKESRLNLMNLLIKIVSAGTLGSDFLDISVVGKVYGCSSNGFMLDDGTVLSKGGSFVIDFFNVFRVLVIISKESNGDYSISGSALQCIDLGFAQIGHFDTVSNTGPTVAYSKKSGSYALGFETQIQFGGFKILLAALYISENVNYFKGTAQIDDGTSTSPQLVVTWNKQKGLRWVLSDFSKLKGILNGQNFLDQFQKLLNSPEVGGSCEKIVELAIKEVAGIYTDLTPTFNFSFTPKPVLTVGFKCIFHIFGKSVDVAEIRVDHTINPSDVSHVEDALTLVKFLAGQIIDLIPEFFKKLGANLEEVAKIVGCLAAVKLGSDVTAKLLCRFKDFPHATEPLNLPHDDPNDPPSPENPPGTSIIERLKQIFNLLDKASRVFDLLAKLGAASELAFDVATAIGILSGLGIVSNFLTNDKKDDGKGNPATGNHTLGSPRLLSDTLMQVDGYIFVCFYSLVDAVHYNVQFSSSPSGINTIYKVPASLKGKPDKRENRVVILPFKSTEILGDGKSGFVSVSVRGVSSTGYSAWSAYPKALWRVGSPTDARLWLGSDNQRLHCSWTGVAHGNYDFICTDIAVASVSIQPNGLLYSASMPLSAIKVDSTKPANSWSLSLHQVCGNGYVVDSLPVVLKSDKDQYLAPAIISATCNNNSRSISVDVASKFVTVLEPSVAINSFVDTELVGLVHQWSASSTTFSVPYSDFNNGKHSMVDQKITFVSDNGIVSNPIHRHANVSGLSAAPSTDRKILNISFLPSLDLNVSFMVSWIGEGFVFEPFLVPRNNSGVVNDSVSCFQTSDGKFVVTITMPVEVVDSTGKGNPINGSVSVIVTDGNSGLPLKMDSSASTVPVTIGHPLPAPSDVTVSLDNTGVKCNITIAPVTDAARYVCILQSTSHNDGSIAMTEVLKLTSVNPTLTISVYDLLKVDSSHLNKFYNVVVSAVSSNGTESSRKASHGFIEQLPVPFTNSPEWRIEGAQGKYLWITYTSNQQGISFYLDSVSADGKLFAVVGESNRNVLQAFIATILDKVKNAGFEFTGCLFLRSCQAGKWSSIPVALVIDFKQLVISHSVTVNGIVNDNFGTASKDLLPRFRAEGLLVANASGYEAQILRYNVDGTSSFWDVMRSSTNEFTVPNTTFSKSWDVSNKFDNDFKMQLIVKGDGGLLLDSKPLSGFVFNQLPVPNVSFAVIDPAKKTIQYSVQSSQYLTQARLQMIIEGYSGIDTTWDPVEISGDVSNGISATITAPGSHMTYAVRYRYQSSTAGRISSFVGRTKIPQHLPVASVSASFVHDIQNIVLLCKFTPSWQTDVAYQLYWENSANPLFDKIVFPFTNSTVKMNNCTLKWDDGEKVFTVALVLNSAGHSVLYGGQYTGGSVIVEVVDPVGSHEVRLNSVPAKSNKIEYKRRNLSIPLPSSWTATDVTFAQSGNTILFDRISSDGSNLFACRMLSDGSGLWDNQTSSFRATCIASCNYHNSHVRVFCGTDGMLYCPSRNDGLVGPNLTSNLFDGTAAIQMSMAEFNGKLWLAIISNTSQGEIFLYHSSAGTFLDAVKVRVSEWCGLEVDIAAFKNKLYLCHIGTQREHQKLFVVPSDDGTYSRNGLAVVENVSHFSVCAYSGRLYVCYVDATTKQMHCLSSEDGMTFRNVFDASFVGPMAIKVVLRVVENKLMVAYIEATTLQCKLSIVL